MQDIPEERIVARRVPHEPSEPINGRLLDGSPSVTPALAAVGCPPAVARSARRYLGGPLAALAVGVCVAGLVTVLTTPGVGLSSGGAATLAFVVRKLYQREERRDNQDHERFLASVKLEHDERLVLSVPPADRVHAIRAVKAPHGPAGRVEASPPGP